MLRGATPGRLATRFHSAKLAETSLKVNDLGPVIQ
jgi:hypothetical protein